MRKKNYIPRKRGKYGYRKGCLKAAFSAMAVGEIRSFPMDSINLSSIRTRAGELNKDAGRTIYSVNWDRFTDSVRIKRTGL